MKRIFILSVVILLSISSYAQKERKLVLNEDTNLIEVTYYHDNGVVSQTGTYSLDGKLEGEWLSYDEDGNKIVFAHYSKGKKDGKWIYWTDETIKEVDYSSNAIASIE